MRWTFFFLVASALAAQDAGDGAQLNTALVRQYPHLDRIVTRAQSLAEEGRYRDALELFVEAVKAYPNHVVPVPGDPSGPRRAASTFLGVSEYCLREIERWPAEGRAAYRAYYDGFARAEFDAARAAKDLEALSAIAERYPFSSYADDALALVANFALDDGNPLRAAEALERLLAMADADLPRPLTAARLALAYAQLGRADALKQLLEFARREFPHATIVQASHPAALDGFMEELARTVRPRAEAAARAPEAWPLFQGSVTGAKVAEATALGSKAWSVPLSRPDFQSEDDEFVYTPSRPLGSAQFRPYFPVVNDGIVYYHDEYSLWAYNLYASGPEPLWTYRVQTPPGPLLFEERMSYTTTVHEGRVYANLITAHGRMETRMQSIQVKFPFPKRALFAFDAFSGKLLWKLGGALDGAGFLDTLSFTAAPTPVDGKLYVGAIRQPISTDPFEHYVLCLDATTGRVLWSTFIASGGTEINLFGNSTRESLGTPVSIRGADLFYGTNHGAFASLDRRTGRLRWLFRYEQLPVNPTRSISIRRNPLEWCPNAPVAWEDQVALAPLDSRQLYAIDAKTGRKLWERPRGELRFLYGVSDGYWVAGGPHVEWYDRHGKFVGRFEPEHGAGAGRGAVTESGVLFPTTQGLYTLRLGSRQASSSYARWPGGAGGGNLTVAEGAIVAAGAASVTAYFDRRDREREILDLLERQPKSPALLYRCALALLHSDRPEQALRIFLRAIEATSGSRRAADERIHQAARRRVFALSLEAGRRSLVAGAPAPAAEHFERALKASLGLAEHVESTMLLCDAYRQANRNRDAVRELQALILKHGDDIVDGQSVLQRARAAIASIVATAGPEVYREFEAKAAELLDAARARGSAEDLVALARRYPNSGAAETAIFEAAVAHERAARTEDAAKTYRLYLREYPQSARAVDAQLALVRILESRRHYSAAAIILRRLRKSADPATRELCEKRLAGEEYRDLAAKAPPPALKPPLKAVGGYLEREAADELYAVRVKGPPPRSLAGVGFVATQSALKAVRWETAAVLWKLDLDAPLRAAFTLDGALFVCTERSARRVQPLTGAVEWTRATPDLQFAEMAGGMLFYVSPDARQEGAASLTAVDAAQGETLWTQACAGGVADLIGLEEHVAVLTHGPNRLAAFEVESGRRTLSRDLDPADVPVYVLGTSGALLYLHLEGAAIEAYDAAAGRRLWPKTLKAFDMAEVRMSEAGVFILGYVDQKMICSLVDLRTGKLLRINENAPLGNIEQLAVTDTHAYVVCQLNAGGKLVVQALSLTTKDLPVAWMTALDDPFESPGLWTRPAGDHFLIARVGRLDTGRFDFVATVLDRDGRAVQNIKGDGSYERQVDFDLANDGLLIVVDNRVEVHQ